MPYTSLRDTASRKSWVNPKRWIINVAIGLDQFVNALTGGSPDETISSRAGRGKFLSGGISRILCRLLNWLEPDHCQKAIQSELEEQHQSEAIRALQRNQKP